MAYWIHTLFQEKSYAYYVLSYLQEKEKTIKEILLILCETTVSKSIKLDKSLQDSKD